MHSHADGRLNRFWFSNAVRGAFGHDACIQLSNANPTNEIEPYETNMTQFH